MKTATDQQHTSTIDSNTIYDSTNLALKVMVSHGLCDIV